MYQLNKKLILIYKGIRILISLLAYKLTKKPFPLHVQIQVTKKCNLKCPYCYRDAENIKQASDFSFEQFTTLIDEIKSQGTKWVRFLGGEPLMRKDIGKMIDYASSQGMVTELNTNGYFIDDLIFDLYNLDSIVISIDGTPQTHNKTRGEGSYQKAIHAVEVCKQHGLTVRLHGCLTKYHTLEDIDHLGELARNYRISFNFSSPSPNFFDTDYKMEGHPSRELILKLHQRMMELKTKGYPITNSFSSLPFIKNWPLPQKDVITQTDIEQMKIPSNQYVECHAGKIFCTLDVDGRVCLCASIWRNGLKYQDVGFKKAFSYVNNRSAYNCVSCNYLANIELNGLFLLHLPILLEIGSYLLGIGSITSKAGWSTMFRRNKSNNCNKLPVKNVL